MASRKNMIDRVKALMAKTTANGCTEQEMMLALKKARDLMTRHDISEADLSFGGEKPKQAEYHYSTRDRISYWLSDAIAGFCGCKTWNTRFTGGKSRTNYIGLESDTIMAMWLTETLVDCVKRETRAYMRANKVPSYFKTCTRNGFQIGIVSRLRQRLVDLTPKSGEMMSNGYDLVVAKNAIVEDAYNGLPFIIHQARTQRARDVAHDSYRDGLAAGDRINLSRPLASGESVRLLAD